MLKLQSLQVSFQSHHWPCHPRPCHLKHWHARPYHVRPSGIRISWKNDDQNDVALLQGDYEISEEIQSPPKYTKTGYTRVSDVPLTSTVFRREIKIHPPFTKFRK